MLEPTLRSVLLVPLILTSCTAEPERATRASGSPPASAQGCSAGSQQACSCAGGQSGMRVCSATANWEDCRCQQPMAQEASAPTLLPPPAMMPAGSAAAGRQARAMGCSPGDYEGEYSCDITLPGDLPFFVAGRVAFSLERDETTQRDCKPGAEFCEDLVIARDSGALSAQAALVYAFSAKLDGGLDCKSGEFRASLVDGIWGLLDGSVDPSAAPRVLDPPTGRFDGSLQGSHARSSGETISGTWMLYDHDNEIRCVGPFNARLNP